MTSTFEKRVELTVKHGNQGGGTVTTAGFLFGPMPAVLGIVLAGLPLVNHRLVEELRLRPGGVHSRCTLLGPDGLFWTGQRLAREIARARRAEGRRVEA